MDVQRMIKQPCVCLCPALLSATLTTPLTVLCNWGEKGGGEGWERKWGGGGGSEEHADQDDMGGRGKGAGG